MSKYDKNNVSFHIIGYDIVVQAEAQKCYSASSSWTSTTGKHPRAQQ